MRRMMSGCLSEGQEGGEGALSISNTTHRISNVAYRVTLIRELRKTNGKHEREPSALNIMTYLKHVRKNMNDLKRVQTLIQKYMRHTDRRSGNGKSNHPYQICSSLKFASKLRLSAYHCPPRISNIVSRIYRRSISRISIGAMGGMCGKRSHIEAYSLSQVYYTSTEKGWEGAELFKMGRADSQGAVWWATWRWNGWVA